MYEFIIKVLESGHWIGIKTKDGDWKVFTYVKPDGKLEGMLQSTTIETSLEVGLLRAHYSKENIENDFTNEYQIVPRIPKSYKVGDLVDILDTPEVREYVKHGDGLSSDGYKKLVGQKGLEVGGVYEDKSITVYNKDESHYCILPHWALVPHFKEEPKLNLTDEELIKELTKRNLL